MSLNSLLRTGLRIGSLKSPCFNASKTILIRPLSFTVSMSRNYTTIPNSSSTPSGVSLEKLTGDDTGIAVITMNRFETRNALSKAFMDQLDAALDNITKDPNTRVVILRSAVDKVFCAGADLKERIKMSESEVIHFLDVLRSTFTKLENIAFPTIAAVDGLALGGGLELALCCDIRVAGANSKLGLPETKLAIIPGAGGTQRLPRLVGTARAKELIFTGRILDPATAEKYGIVQHAVNDSAYNKALEIAREILPKGPVAIKGAKKAVSQALNEDIETGLTIERECYATTIPTKDRLEGLKAFQEKRTPKYSGN